MKRPTVETILRRWLINNNYDGLMNPNGECGCRLADLMPCGDGFTNCEPGRMPARCLCNDCPEGWDFCLNPNGTCVYEEEMKK